MVKDLIDHENKEWKIDVLINNFLAIDIPAIEQISIINTNHKDELMWMFEPKGGYTVKSGYTAIQTWKSRTNTSPTTSFSDNKLWKKL